MNLSKNVEMDVQKTKILRIHRKNNHRKVLSMILGRVKNPLDEIIFECLKIHKTLRKSDRLLNKFSRELNSITLSMDRIRNRREVEETTFVISGSSENSIIDHQQLFSSCLDNADYFDEEICEILKSKHDNLLINEEDHEEEISSLSNENRLAACGIDSDSNWIKAEIGPEKDCEDEILYGIKKFNK